MAANRHCFSNNVGEQKPKIPFAIQNFNATHLKRFVQSRFLDKRYNVDLTNISDLELRELVQTHWNDTTPVGLKKRSSVDFSPMPSGDAQAVPLSDLGEIEGLVETLGLDLGKLKEISK
jgi:hypothetical protein